MEAMRERTLVGLFVLVAGGVLFGTMIVLSGGIGRANVPHRAYFKFAGGVQVGAPVRFGGMMVGKVQAVRVDPENSTRIEIDERKKAEQCDAKAQRSHGNFQRSFRAFGA